MEKCEGSKCCYTMCNKFIKLCGVGLILWGMGYTINSFIHLAGWWGFYPSFFLLKYVLFRLGISCAAVLFAAMAMHYNCGCCAHGASCCEPKATK